MHKFVEIYMKYYTNYLVPVMLPHLHLHIPSVFVSRGILKISGQQQWRWVQEPFAHIVAAVPTLPPRMCKRIQWFQLYSSYCTAPPPPPHPTTTTTTHPFNIMTDSTPQDNDHWKLTPNLDVFIENYFKIIIYIYICIYICIYIYCLTFWCGELSCVTIDQNINQPLTSWIVCQTRIY